MGKLRNMTSIYLTYENQILLLYRQGSRVVNNMWVGSAGGHFEPDELNDATACVMRELNEELGITRDMLRNIQLRYISLYNKPAELRQNYYYFAELKNKDDINLVSDEGQLKWFDISEIPALEMPFTSHHVTRHWLKEGRFNDKFYAAVSTDNDMVFLEMKEF
ncbi:MAG: NUDIX domain-containing protein [Oscillospiraceae bacterium]|nr:NUDIX domain-containing protein [Oscillospiraceae bacterium]